MKKLIVLLFLIPVIAFGGTISAMFEPDGSGNIHALIFGTLPDGSIKDVLLTTASDKNKVVNVRDATEFNTSRGIIRGWIHFKGDGTLDRIVFHMSSPMENQTYRGTSESTTYDGQGNMTVTTVQNLSATTTNKIAILKTMLDAK